MSKAVIFFAPGLEECEGLLCVDILRRAGVEVTIAAVGGVQTVKSARQVNVVADALAEDLDYSAFDACILPGGLPGSTNLSADETLRRMIADADSAGVPLSAICAAPLVYGRMGLLKGVRVTCYSGFETELEGAVVDQVPVVVDGRFTTGWGPGAAFDFAFAIVERFCGQEKVKELKSGMRVY